MSIRNTKIIATLGPASDNRACIDRLISAGMDTARINFSHGTVSAHRAAIALVRTESQKHKKFVAVLQDLSGPKLRIDTIAPEPVYCTAGSLITITTRKIIGNARAFSISTIPFLAEKIKKGDRILLNDGAVCLVTRSAEKSGITAEVTEPGYIGSHKGLHLPDTDLPGLSGLTRKDRADLRVGLQCGVDYIALSFVRSPADVRALKRIIRAAGKSIPVIAKIEKSEALGCLDGIIEESDGVMVARGDLGVETDLATVALKQKEIIRTCNRHGKIVITATQMLESMIEHPSPTRAEVSDITNAVFDGTDALMLSAETAIGKDPVRAVAMMARIARMTEDELDQTRFLGALPREGSLPDAVAHAACLLSKEIKAEAIIATTMSGTTARLLSKYRPLPPIIAAAPDRNILFRLNLVWGVFPFYIPHEKNTDTLIRQVTRKALRSGIVKKGSRVVICAGVPLGKPSGTNLIKVITL